MKGNLQRQIDAARLDGIVIGMERSRDMLNNMRFRFGAEVIERAMEELQSAIIIAHEKHLKKLER